MTISTVAKRVIEGDVTDTPTLRVLSLGAGVQSTTLLMLSAEGVLPKLDYAIFADTGAEPQEVYDHLDRLEREIARPAGIPIIRVQYGNLDNDLFDPNKMSSIPAFTASKWRTVKRVAAWKLCGQTTTSDDGLDGAGEGCGWARFRVLADQKAWRGLFDELPMAARRRENGRVTLAELEQAAAENPTMGPEDGYAPVPEATVARAMKRLGLDVMPAPCASCNSSGRIPVAWQMVQERDLGMIRRFCTQKYKIRGIMEQVRLLLGAKAGAERPCNKCDGAGQRVAPWRAKRGEDETGECSVCGGLGSLSRIGQPPAGKWVEQWVGFSTDEIDRASDIKDSRYSRSRHPLLELNMTRTQCRAYLASRGWASTPKSACYFCPYRSNASWRRMRDTNPAEWQRAVDFDHRFRTGPGLDGERFLHISALPLDQAPIDRIQRREFEQGDLLDLAFEGELELEEEEDEVQGCSPFGCPSGGQQGGLLTVQSRSAA
ncbi:MULTISPECIES: hypothetical protein [unclassified Streptomyces]|uniref:hypothetical protein n=1 Tax=unclassified Streptomyces TaxID=2593676 RepID=UPI0008911BF8|nr:MULTISPECIES: hypothetical protein [unclassified Streptomyces]PBC72348.1 hypothetical protein BX261_7432 [Streptomyces sp. 2321.6]SDR62088.1 hypothetical protein SAMN05216511_7271 [Streptomyces sp. KS_16]SEE50155.1 hypothetical protein SAMN05428940_7320 [Streptomyces sp. 2133.1]SNC77852.1 hypothetical protein SAMN06272741_7268 [Streptomyces sp. 2114.4]